MAERAPYAVWAAHEIVRVQIRARARYIRHYSIVSPGVESSIRRAIVEWEKGMWVPTTLFLYPGHKVRTALNPTELLQWVTE